MNKYTGNIALGIKLHLFDNVNEQILSHEELGKISWLPDKPDFWGVSTSEGGAFVVLPYPMVDAATEIIARF